MKKQVILRERGADAGIDHPACRMPSDPTPPPRESVEVDEGISTHTRRYDKSERAAEPPLTMGCLRQVYADAIEYPSPMRKGGGGTLVFSLIPALPFLAACISLGMKAGSMGPRDWIALAVLLPCMFALTFWIVADAVSSLCDDLLFALEDAPIIFDRRHRKVYRLLPHEGTGIRNVIRRRPLVAHAYDWNLVDVECSTRLGVSYSDTNESTLVFSVRHCPACRVSIGGFRIEMRLEKPGTLEPMWEHIRRFMEEDGPALPDPAEGMAPRTVRQSWWACLRLTGPDAPWFLRDWRVSPIGSLLSLLLSPVSLPVRLVWGTSDYLVRRTQIPVQWPALVQERIGLPIPVPAHGAPVARTRA